jgi:hypothetical protein
MKGGFKKNEQGGGRFRGMFYERTRIDCWRSARPLFRQFQLDRKQRAVQHAAAAARITSRCDGGSVFVLAGCPFKGVLDH